MRDETFAAKSAMFNRWAMLSTSLRSFDGANFLRRNKIWCLISDVPLAVLECSTAMVLSCALPFLKVGAAATEMVFPFGMTVVHCCTGRVLSPDAAMVTMLGRASVCVCVRAEVSAGARFGACAVQRGWGALPLAVYNLGVCLFAAAAKTFRYEINGRQVTVAGRIYVDVALAAAVLPTSQVRSATQFWRLVLSSLTWSMILFDSSIWMLAMVIILQVDIVSIFRVSVLSRAVSYLFTKSLIPLFIKSVSHV